MWSVASNSLPGQLVHVKQKIFTNFCCSELLRVPETGVLATKDLVKIVSRNLMMGTVPSMLQFFSSWQPALRTPARSQSRDRSIALTAPRR